MKPWCWPRSPGREHQERCLGADLINPGLHSRGQRRRHRRLPGYPPDRLRPCGRRQYHYNLTQPDGADGAEFLARWDEICHIVHDVARSLRGSFSAEHGIGKIKVAELAQHKAGVELDMMHGIKARSTPKAL